MYLFEHKLLKSSVSSKNIKKEFINLKYSL